MFAIISHPDAGEITLTKKLLLFGLVPYLLPELLRTANSSKLESLSTF